MKPSLANHREEEAALPTVAAERCVHSLSHLATCAACIDACPVGAWLIDDDGLNLDVAACDGCGLCAPACPQEAIQLYIKPVTSLLASRRVAFAACERAAVPAGRGVIPCLHALGVNALARLHLQGIEHLVVAHGDCQACPRGEAASLEQAVRLLNLYLTDRGFAPIERIEVDVPTWRRVLATSNEAGVNGVSRRRFLQRARETFAEADENEASAPTPPTLGCLVVDGERADAVIPCSPAIAPDHCEGCDACVRLCPNGVFTIEEDGSAYEIDPLRCTGCGLCVDVCETDAIALEHWSRSPKRRLQLEEKNCRACGVRFHLPKNRPSKDGFCRICSRTRHHEKLFQVLD